MHIVSVVFSREINRRSYIQRDLHNSILEHSRFNLIDFHCEIIDLDNVYCQLKLQTNLQKKTTKKSEELKYLEHRY